MNQRGAGGGPGERALPLKVPYVQVPDLRRDRYGTLRLMSWWDQEVVAAARVLVVGAGAIGNEVLKNLALLGFQDLVVVDRDVVELANLSRSVLYRAADEGRPKAEVAAERVRELNPDVQIFAVNGDIERDIGLAVFRHADVVIGCLDSRAARLWVNNACRKTGTPWVDGAIQEMFGEVRVFGATGACYACTLTNADWKVLREARPCSGLAMGNILEGKVPTTPTIASIIGAIQVQEALKLVHGMGSTVGKAFVFRGITMEGDRLTLNERDDCLSHYAFGDVVELSDRGAATTTFRDLLALAEEALGGQAYIDLHGREVVSLLECPSCGHSTQLGVLEAQVTPDLAPCPHCGFAMRDPETTHTVTTLDWFVDRTPADVGLPALDIVEARTATASVAFELTGDASTAVGGGWVARR